MIRLCHVSSIWPCRDDRMPIPSLSRSEPEAGRGQRRLLSLSCPPSSPPRPTVLRGDAMSVGSALRAVLLVAAALGGLACRSRTVAPPPSAPPLRLGAVTIQVAAQPDHGSPAIDGQAVSDRIRATLAASGLVVAPRADAAAPAGADPAGGTLRIAGVVAAEVVEVERKGLCRAGVSLKIDTRPSDAPGAIDEDLSATGEERFDTARVGDRGALAQRLAERTAIDLVAGLIARARLRTAAPAEIHAAIASADAGVSLREEAIRVAGKRGLTGEATALLGLLDDPEEPIRDAALGALIAFRDQRAVSQLARNRSFRDKREMAKILEAISLIGGEEAQQYLSFVADGHEDEEIRQQAAQARDRLLRRARDGGTPTGVK